MADITVNTPKTNTTVVIREFAPARLKNRLKRLFSEGAEIDMKKFVQAQKMKQEGKEITAQDIGTDENSTVPMETIFEAEKISVEVMVLSIGGKTENVYDALEDLPEEDYDYVMKQINEVTGELDQKKA